MWGIHIQRTMLKFWSIINIATIILWLQCRNISAGISLANFAVEEKYGKLCMYNKKNPDSISVFRSYD